MACKHGRVEICKELIAHGYDVNEKAGTLSLLHQAIDTKNSTLIDLFLEKQREVNVQDEEGETALYRAARQGDDKLMEYLLLKKAKYKIDINASSKTKKTPLHCAVESGQAGSVRLLLKYGALANEQDKYGKSPLMYASEKKDVESCKMIKEKVATVSFNEVKSYLGSLVRGHKELERLFGVAYEAVPLTQEMVTSNEIGGYEVIEQGREGENVDDDNYIDQVSESGTQGVVDLRE